MTDLAGSRPKGITVTIDGRAETASALAGDGQLSRLAGRHRADRTHARAGRRQSRGAGRRHAERSLLADALRGRSRRAGQNHQHQQSSCDHRRRDAGVIYRNAACQRPLTRLHDAAQARRSNQRRRSAHERCDRVVGADDGPPQTGHHARAGEGEPGTGLPASGARRIGSLSCGGIREGQKPVAQPGTDRRPSPARRLGKPRHVRHRRDSR